MRFSITGPEAVQLIGGVIPTALRDRLAEALPIKACRNCGESFRITTGVSQHRSDAIYCCHGCAKATAQRDFNRRQSERRRMAEALDRLRTTTRDIATESEGA